MKISAERLSINNWTVTIDGTSRTGMTRDEAWSALDISISMDKAKLCDSHADLLEACEQAAVSLRAIYGLMPCETCSEIMLLDAAIAKAKP